MVEGAPRGGAAPLLHQIYKLLSDTMLTWVNNVRAKQRYRSATQPSESVSPEFTVGAQVVVVAVLPHTDDDRVLVVLGGFV
jgi:hypothetical protein